uniref:G_PROTEIN_RECEP_F1_2 domain-containing protein n=1 Tax=Macrostomum lignano TaxID=282301 RepID=A0A1I8HFH6_9PLAT
MSISGNLSDSSSGHCVTLAYLQSAGFALLTAGLALINAAVILGNILVVLAACTSTKLQGALTSTFVVSLAVSDLLLGLGVLPFSITHQVLLKHWVFSSWWCQIWLALDVWTCTASILNLVIISLDRYISLRHPLKYPNLMDRKRARLLVAGVWALACAISLPTLLKLLLQTDADENDSLRRSTWLEQDKRTANESVGDCLQLGPTCTIAHSTPGYIVYSALGSFFLPFLIMTYFYAHIFAAVHRTLKAGRRGAAENGQLRIHRGGGGGGGGGTASGVGGSGSGCGRGETLLSAPTGSGAVPRQASWTTLAATAATRRAAQFTSGGRYGRELKAARMLAIICITFVGCWAPFFSVYLYGAVCPDCISALAFDICFWLGYVNSALNPLIYALFSADYRRAFKTLILRRRRRQYDTIGTLARRGLHGMGALAGARRDQLNQG